MPVTLVPALATDEPVLQNLIQFYTHDFSEFWAGTARGDLLPDGRFEPYPLADYWARPERSAFLILRNGILAGFALINDHANSGKPVARNLAEFFILRKHRGHGVGRAAARALFAAHPGSWEVAVARRNLPARAFWDKVIRTVSEAGSIEELDLADDNWNGPVFRFEWAPAAPPSAP